jgi:hypothetical protein
MARDAKCAGRAMAWSKREDSLGKSGEEGGKKDIGEEILVDQSSMVEGVEGDDEEKMEDVGEEWKQGECWVGKKDLERAESGVKRPRICSAVCGGRVILLGEGERRGVEW